MIQTPNPGQAKCQVDYEFNLRASFWACPRGLASLAQSPVPVKRAIVGNAPDCSLTDGNSRGIANCRKPRNLKALVLVVSLVVVVISLLESLEGGNIYFAPLHVRPR